MKLAVSVILPEVQGEAPLGLLSGSFRERLQKAAAYGYTGVELLCCHPEQVDAEQVKALLQEYGLQAAAIATGFIAASRHLTLVAEDPEVRAQAEKLLQGLVELAGKLGAPAVTVGSFRGKACFVGSQEEAVRVLHGALASAEDRARELGVTIALESINPGETDLLNTARQVCRFIEEGNHRAVSLLLDSYHVFGSEQEPEQVYRECRDYVSHVHISDSSRLPAGQGTIPFDRMEALLREIGYEGWQSAELARGEAPDENARLTAEHMLPLMK